MQTGVINEFRGEYYFLSNYHTAPMEWRRAEFKSAEQAFAYAKTFFATGKPQDVEHIRENIMFAKTPGSAGTRPSTLLRLRLPSSRPTSSTPSERLPTTSRVSSCLSTRSQTAMAG